MEEVLKKEKNLTEGSLWNKILIFAIPLALSSMLQQLFNSADVAVVGRFADKNALAAVGSNGPIINLMVNLFVGLSVGANVVISRYIGQQDHKQIEKAVHTSILLAIVSGLFLAVLGLFISRPMLQFMKSPSETIDLATTYLKIYFLGMPFEMLYNFSSAILRSKGDTERPLISLLISGVINVALNFVFVLGLKMSVSGVAIATVISEIVSSSLLLYFLTHEKGYLKLDFKKLAIDGRILKEIARIGIPSGLQGMVFSISNISIQSEINDLGSVIMSASAVALNFEIFVYYLLNAFGQASVTFTGQNYGACKLDRCKKSVMLCMLLGGLATIIMSSLVLIFANPLSSLYSTDTEVIKLAVIRMKWIISFELVNLAIEVFSGSLRGYGYSLVPAMISIFGICGFRILWVNTIYKSNPTFERLLMAYPISWLITATFIVASYFVVKKHIKKEVQDELSHREIELSNR